MKNPIAQCQLCFYGATSVKKNSCLVPRIVSFDTAKSRNSIFNLTILTILTIF